jgi:hypothetical protein
MAGQDSRAFIDLETDGSHSQVGTVRRAGLAPSVVGVASDAR